MENLQDYWEKDADLGGIVISHGARKEKEKNKTRQHTLTVSAMEYSELSFFARP